jgi:hypothetical protein
VIPATWVSVVLFLLLIAPGLLYDQLAQRRRVAPTESGFREASRVILASLIFSAIGLSVVAIARAVLPSLLPDPTALLSNQRTYVAAHYRLVAAALVLEVGVAVGLAWVVSVWLARRHGAPLRHESAWTRVLRKSTPAGRRPYVRVRLQNGTVYMGAVAHATADLELDERELVLAPPLFSNTETGELRPTEPEWQRIVLQGSQIESLAVRYEPSGGAARPPASPD